MQTGHSASFLHLHLVFFRSSPFPFSLYSIKVLFFSALFVTFASVDVLGYCVNGGVTSTFVLNLRPNYYIDHRV